MGLLKFYRAQNCPVSSLKLLCHIGSELWNINTVKNGHSNPLVNSLKEKEHSKFSIHMNKGSTYDKTKTSCW